MLFESKQMLKYNFFTITFLALQGHVLPKHIYLACLPLFLCFLFTLWKSLGSFLSTFLLSLLSFISKQVSLNKSYLARQMPSFCTNSKCKHINKFKIMCLYTQIWCFLVTPRGPQAFLMVLHSEITPSSLRESYEMVCTRYLLCFRPMCVYFL